MIKRKRSAPIPLTPAHRTLPTAVNHVQATRTGMFVAVGSGLGVSYALLKHGRMLLQLFLGGNPAGEWKRKTVLCTHPTSDAFYFQLYMVSAHQPPPLRSEIVRVVLARVHPPNRFACVVALELAPVGFLVRHEVSVLFVKEKARFLFIFLRRPVVVFRSCMPS